MKVLKIVYKTKENEHIRTVLFNKAGLSIVFSNVINDKNLKKTTNGVGKTIVTRTIDYIYGGSSDKSLTEKLSNYYFEATILINNEEHIVTRYFEKNGKILFDDVPLSINEYKQKINADRSTLRKLLLLNARKSIAETPDISYNANDLSSIFRLLDLESISQLVISVRTQISDLSNIRESKKKLLDVMEVSSKDIDIRLVKNKEELKNARAEELRVKNELQTLSVNGENDNIQKQFENDNREVKRLRRENYILESEISQLNSYLNSASSFSLTTEEIKDIYEEAGLFIKQGIIEKLNEAEEFYKKLIEDRNKQINKRIKNIKSSIENNNVKIVQLNRSLSEKSLILSKNDAYQNAVILLSDIQNKLEDLTLESGRLEQYSKLDKKESEITQELSKLYSDLNIEKGKTKETTDGFKTFVNNVSKRLYEDDEALLNIDFKAYKEVGLPCSLDISFRKGQSSGVSLVKNIIFDYLLFKFDKNNEILMHDSNCFGDIDTRQVATLLTIGNEIANEKNKQYIVALNRDNVHESAQKFVENKTVLWLSEEDLLLHKQF